MSKHYLKDRSVISIRGADAFTFLQGLITNDVNKLNSQPCVYAFMLSPQGRILYDFFLIKVADEIRIDCPEEHRSEILKKLMMYKLKSDVIISDMSDSLYVHISDIPLGEIYYSDPRTDTLLFRCIISDDFGIDSDFYDAYEQTRIQNKIPDYSQDCIYNRSLPLEMRGIETNAVDFQKGCYVGQEVTARMNYRATLRKDLFVLSSSTSSFPAKETELLYDGKKVGIMLGHHNNLGLALLNFEEIGGKDAKNVVLSDTQNTLHILC